MLSWLGLGCPDQLAPQLWLQEQQALASWAHLYAAVMILVYASIHKLLLVNLIVCLGVGFDKHSLTSS